MAANSEALPPSVAGTWWSIVGHYVRLFFTLFTETTWAAHREAIAANLTLQQAIISLLISAIWTTACLLRLQHCRMRLPRGWLSSAPDGRCCCACPLCCGMPTVGKLLSSGRKRQGPQRQSATPQPY